MSTVISHDSTREDIEERLLELRKDFAELPERERRSAEESERVAAMIPEVEELDKRLTLEDIHELREERKRKLEEARRSEFTGVATAPSGSRETRGMGDVFVQSEEFQAWEKRGFALQPGQPGMSLDLPWGMRTLETRAVAEWTSGGPSNAATGDASALLPVAQPMAPNPRQARLFIEDLIPHSPTTYAQVPYVRELNPTATELSASAVSESVTKPDAGVSFQAVVAPISTIAVTMTMTKQLFSDSNAVVAYVQQRLPYFIKYKVQSELLGGGGTWPDITGILNTTGILSQTYTSTDIAITVGQALAKLEIQDGTGTGIAFNPVDYWDMVTKRAAGGSGTFDAGGPFGNPLLTVWGVPSVRSRVQTQGTALVGDFAQGAGIFDREQITLSVYQEVKAATNEVLLVCECRLGLAVYRPDLFVNAAVA